jgi:serine/threonine-protein kinase
MAKSISEEAIASYPGALCSKYFALGQLTKRQGNEAEAREFFFKAKTFVERDLEQDPNNGPGHGQLALVLAWMGEKEGALAEMKRAEELVPVSKDAFSGPDVMEAAAEMHAVFGDAGRAVSILDQILQRPAGLTVPILKLNPVWDPIRNDQRFQALIQKYSAKS